MKFSKDIRIDHSTLFSIYSNHAMFTGRCDRSENLFLIEDE
jgi:hypothetical protein